MLQIPTNVYPHNTAVEISSAHPFCSTYTFNGDLLRWGLCDYYDNVTGEKTLSSYFPRGGSIGMYHNGDTVNISHRYTIDYFKNGYDYKYNYTLFQSNPTEVENNDDSDGGLYNIFLTESYFTEDASTANLYRNGEPIKDDDGNVINYQKIGIDPNIRNIRSAYYYTYDSASKPSLRGQTKLIGGCYVEINHERRFVDYYIDGYLYLAYGFKTPPKKGERFRIYCNYIVSPFYFFKARKDPVIKNMDVVLNKSELSIDCNAKYEQANDVTMKYHRWQLYKCNGYSEIPGASGYVRDLAKELDQAATEEEQDEIEKLMSMLNNKTIIIDKELGDIVGQTVIITSGITDSAISYSSHINTYDAATGVATLSVSLPINPIAVSTNNPDIPSETNISYKVVSYDSQLVGDSGAVYSYTMTHKFYEFPFEVNDLGKQVMFRIRLEVCTQDGKVVYKDIYKTFVYEQDESLYVKGMSNDQRNIPFVDVSRRAIHLTWSGSQSNIKYAVYRKRVDKNETETPMFSNSSAASCYDYLVGNNRIYRYYIVPYRVNGTIGKVFVTPDITVSWCGWSLSALTPVNTRSFGKSSYKYNAGETWVLNFERGNSTITQNQNKYIHFGVSSYPKVSIEQSSYISGSFSAMLGNYDMEAHQFDDTVSKVDNWREFISGDTPYLLKTSKGDVWLVSISSEASTSYDEALKGIPTTVEFEFTECDSIHNISVS